MTVRAIRLENFMAFADTDWIELRPISLLFGRNSSGKSAIIRALRLLKQSRDQLPAASPAHFPLNFFHEHGLDQGGFENSVNLRPPEVAEKEQDPPLRDARQRVITFHLRCELVDTADALLGFVNRYLESMQQPPLNPDNTPNPRWADLSLGFARSYNSDSKDWQVELVRVEVGCSWPALATGLMVFWAARTGWEEREVARGSDPEWWWLQEWHGPYSTLLFDDDWVTAADEPANPLSLPSTGFLATLRAPLELLREDDLTRQSTGTAFITTLLVEMSSVIYEFLQAMQYLGPMRPEPERLYRFNAIDAAAWRERGWGSYLDFLSLKMPDTSLIDQIGEWFGHLDLGPTVLPKEAHLDGGFLSQVSVYEEKDGIPFNLRDAGYGASQVLPILVHSLMARPGSLVIIEQPELHLHPRAQTRLGDLFVSAIFSLQKKDGDKREQVFPPLTLPQLMKQAKTSELEWNATKVCFLLETHSEHLVLRFQRWVRSLQKPSRSDLLVMYATRASGTTTLHPLRLDEEGEFIDKWPEGFFEEGFYEMFDIELESDKHNLEE